MSVPEITRCRLINQQLAAPHFRKPAEVVAWMGGMQGQDYVNSRWAVGIRMQQGKEDVVEQALARGEIVRSWPLRGTLHLAAATDIRWMLSLSAARMIASNASRYKQLELDQATLVRSQSVLVRALEGKKQLTREELTTVLAKKGIQAEGVRLSHILQRAGLERLVCFGARRGNEFTYTLLDEWVPAGSEMGREEALAELARRYFQSRGPATLQDFVWWSGLSVTDARKGLEQVKSALESRSIGGQAYWQPDTPQGKAPLKSAYLLPAFDEYIIAYRDRSACLDNAHALHVIQRNGIFNPAVIEKGRATGTWKRTFRKDTVEIELIPFSSDKQAGKLVMAAAERYARFVGKIFVQK